MIDDSSERFMWRAKWWFLDHIWTLMHGEVGSEPTLTLRHLEVNVP